MASAEFGEETDSKLPTVQVGDPFMEKLLLECCLEIFATGCLEGIQDMGAAGLTSSSVEMAARAGNGIELHLDAIPRRTKRLTPYEMLLSESQERMLMVAKAGREQQVLDACAKWDLEAAVVGVVTDTGRFVCTATPGHDPLDPESASPAPVVVADLPIGLLADDAPKYDRPQEEPEPAERDTAEVPLLGDAPGRQTEDLGAELLTHVGSPNIRSRRRIWRQYDHVVRDGTVLGPGQADAAVVRVFCEEPGKPTIRKALAMSVDCNGRHVELDPFQGAAMAVAECARNVACAGAKPLGTTDCLNFGNPEVPETMWRFARAIDGLAAACKALDVPIVSGNVSLYNETDGRPILPTPTVAVVGLLDDVEDRVELRFRSAGDLVAHLGVPSRGELGGSEWLTQRVGGVSGAPVGIDLDAEKALQQCLRELAKARVLASAHDVSDGGLGACLAESCIAGGMGATVRVPAAPAAPLEARLFAEEPTRVVLSFAPAQRETVEAIAARHGVPLEVLGEVGGDALVLRDGETEAARVDVGALAKRHGAALDAIVAE
ncbi:MAG: AIR synthase-related protein [Myxococcota bacterium]